jgi:hypothetical protein
MGLTPPPIVKHKVNYIISPKIFIMKGVLTLTPLPPRRTTERTDTSNIIYKDVVDVGYSMLLGRPWFKDAEITHDWANNIMMIQGNGMVRTIVMTKHLRIRVK